jgi:hypothetical protein
MWKAAYTVNIQLNTLKENDLGHFPVSYIQNNFHLEEIRTSS